MGGVARGPDLWLALVVAWRGEASPQSGLPCSTLRHTCVPMCCQLDSGPAPATCVLRRPAALPAPPCPGRRPPLDPPVHPPPPFGVFALCLCRSPAPTTCAPPSCRQRPTWQRWPQSFQSSTRQAAVHKESSSNASCWIQGLRFECKLLLRRCRRCCCRRCRCRRCSRRRCRRCGCRLAAPHLPLAPPRAPPACRRSCSAMSRMGPARTAAPERRAAACSSLQQQQQQRGVCDAHPCTRTLPTSAAARLPQLPQSTFAF